MVGIRKWVLQPAWPYHHPENPRPLLLSSVWVAQMDICLPGVHCVLRRVDPGGSAGKWLCPIHSYLCPFAVCIVQGLLVPRDVPVPSHWPVISGSPFQVSLPWRV